MRSMVTIDEIDDSHNDSSPCDNMQYTRPMILVDEVNDLRDDPSLWNMAPSEYFTLAHEFP